MKTMRCGARGSRLSVIQAEGGIAFIAGHVRGFRAKLVTFDTPGDRDVITPIEQSAPDFFTRDLDEAVRMGRIDFALHSAKDLPEPMSDDLDWFWLPCREDPRDCWVMREGTGSMAAPATIGVSSARRAAYAKNVYPKAMQMPVRGPIDSRLRQVAEGRFDAVLMAMAGIRRLYPDLACDGLPVRIVPIPLAELTPPDGQGFLAAVFRKGDERFTAIRRQFVKAVRFTSAGVGNAGLITMRGAQDIAEADVVLADALTGFGGWRSGAAIWIDVGKRCGVHSMSQDEITRLICDEVRKGRRVVRLKGGDAGLFGRLSEETEALDALGVPYLVRPGVSALTAATAPNGILLTKRRDARGFSVSTPRSSGAKTPKVFFMASRVAADTLKRFPPSTPYAMIWDAGGPYERVETGVCGKPAPANGDLPGLLVVGYVGKPLSRKRILLTCSAAVMPRATCVFEDRGWRTVEWPMVSVEPRAEIAARLRSLKERFDAIVLTSPSAVRIFFSVWRGDRRDLPQFWTCGAGTDAELRRYGIASDIMPTEDFSADGLIRRLKQEGTRLKGTRVLRLRSARAARSVAAALRRIGALVEDAVLYDTLPVHHDGATLPPCDAVFFASASAVESFLSRHGAAALSRKEIYVIGEPTRRALPPRFRKRAMLAPLQSSETVSMADAVEPRKPKTTQHK